jgi:hypothetical protein
MMAILLMLPLLLGNFVQKWAIPQGIDWGAGRIVIGDTDRDGNCEFIFSTYGGSYTIYFYELHLPDTWMIDSVPDLNQPLLWNIGDFDADGFYDLVMQSSWGAPSIGIAIFESPDSLSYPTQEVWRDTVGPPLVLPISAYDIDQDGLHELVKMGGDLDTAYYTDFLIYESTGDNTYSVTYTIATETSPTSTVAFGDYDQDDFNEFAMGTIDGEYSVFESPHDNTYEARILNQQLPTVNIRDCFSVPDADGDGKLEFVVKGFIVPTARVNAFIFEATGDNTYEVIDSLDLFGGSNDYYGGYSDVGDVDGDSIPEIALEACQNIYIIKAAANDSFYVWDYIYGNYSGSSVRVYDIDGNGLSEVIISGNNQTRIYEYEVGIAETAGVVVQGSKLHIHPNPFTQALNIRFQNSTDKGVVVKIYDASGRMVKYFYLASSIQHQESSIVWHGDDEQGRAVAPGVYFVRLQAKGYAKTEKVVLLQ